MRKSRIVNITGLLFILIYIITHYFCPLSNLCEVLISTFIEGYDNKKEGK